MFKRKLMQSKKSDSFGPEAQVAPGPDDTNKIPANGQHQTDANPTKGPAWGQANKKKLGNTNKGVSSSAHQSTNKTSSSKPSSQQSKSSEIEKNKGNISNDQKHSNESVSNNESEESGVLANERRFSKRIANSNNDNKHSDCKAVNNLAARHDDDGEDDNNDNNQDLSSNNTNNRIVTTRSRLGNNNNNNNDDHDDTNNKQITQQQTTHQVIHNDNDKNYTDDSTANEGNESKEYPPSNGGSVQAGDLSHVANDDDDELQGDDANNSKEEGERKNEEKKLENDHCKKEQVSSPPATIKDQEIIYDNCDITQEEMEEEKCKIITDATITTPKNSTPSKSNNFDIISPTKGENVDNSLGPTDPGDTKKSVSNEISNTNDANHFGDKIKCSKSNKKIAKDELKRIEKETKKLRKQLVKENKKKMSQDDRSNIKDNNNNEITAKSIIQSQDKQKLISPANETSPLINDDQQGEMDRQLKQKLPADKTTKELKIFQDHKLINQLDPMEDLKNRLNELNRNDNDIVKKQKKASIFSKNQQNHPTINENNSFNHKQQSTNDSQPVYGNQLQHEENFDDQEQSEYYNINAKNGNHQLANPFTPNTNQNRGVNFNGDGEQNIDNNIDDDFTTIKKGVLWVHQNYDKLSSKLFSRWKKRYFILTTDYFVCFKRSQSKVGHSEMGSFIYKASLGDITKVAWLKEKNSEKKGPIVMHIRDRPNMLVWSKKNLDDWYVLTQEAIKRNKLRRSCHQTQLEQQRDQQHEQEQHLADSKRTDNSVENETDQVYENYDLQNATKEFLEKCDVDITSMVDEMGVPIKPLPPPPSNKNAILDVQTKVAVRSTGDESTTRDSSCDGISSNAFNYSNRVPNSQCQEKNNAQQSISESNHRHQQSVDNNLTQTEIPDQGQHQNNNNQTPSSNRHVLRPRPSGNNVGHVILEEGRDLETSAEMIGSLQTPGKVRNRTVNNDVNNNPSRVPNPDSRDHRRAKGEDQFSESDKNKSSMMRINETDNHSSHVLSTSSSSPPIPPPRVTGLASNRLPDLNQQTGNLIRRGDSWQSLASLNQAGQLNQTGLNNGKHFQHPSAGVSGTPQHIGYVQQQKNHHHQQDNQFLLQDAKQSLYAAKKKLAMANTASSGNTEHASALTELELQRKLQRTHKIDIESTVTPIRANGPGLNALLQQRYNNNNDISSQPEFNNHHQRQSNQPHSDRKKTPALGQHETVSFDMGFGPSSPSVTKGQFNGNNLRDSTCKRKLLQLQLLHEQQRSDCGDYQIYEGADTSFQHYGHFGGAAYSSMRSNLKTATSEFAFIRPSSSGLSSDGKQLQVSGADGPLTRAQNQSGNQINDNQMATSTLNRRSARKPSNSLMMRLLPQQTNRGGRGIENQITQLNPIRSSLIHNDNNIQTNGTPIHKHRAATNQMGQPSSWNNDSQQNVQSPTNFMTTMMNDQQLELNPQNNLADQNANLIRNKGSSQNTNGLEHGYNNNPATFGDNENCLLRQPPVCVWSNNSELPMKANKKRKPPPGNRHSCEAGCGSSNMPKSSSVTSSIASFFRRAFSGRRRNRKGAGKSGNCGEPFCSASLNAFNDHHSHNGCATSSKSHEIRSAFSTGGKSDHELTLSSSHFVVSDNAQRQHFQQENCSSGREMPKAFEAQSPRMFDMIQAFQDNNHAVELASDQQHQRHQHQQQSNDSMMKDMFIQQQRTKLIGTSQVGGISSHQIAPSPAKFINNNHSIGSPLHKSNSVSTTLNTTEQHQHPIQNNRNMLGNRMNRDARVQSGARHIRDTDFLTPAHSPRVSNNQKENILPSSAMLNLNHQNESSASPIMMRPNEMNINTNDGFNNAQMISTRKSPNVPPATPGKGDYHPLAQPRARAANHSAMPRPSSIYGQPSLISSPSIHSVGPGGSSVSHYNPQRNSLVVMGANGCGFSSGHDSIQQLDSNINNNDHGNHYFGQHLNQTGTRHIVYPLNSQPSTKNGPYLDTTCELGEDLDSPTRDQFNKIALHQSQSNFLTDNTHHQQNHHRLSLIENQSAINHNHLASSEHPTNSHYQKQHIDASIQHQLRQSAGLSNSISYSPLSYSKKNNGASSSNRPTHVNPRVKQAAIVNPILQEVESGDMSQQPMDSIYDNHPNLLNSSSMVQSGNNRASIHEFSMGLNDVNDNANYNHHSRDDQPRSHYDNHDGASMSYRVEHNNWNNSSTVTGLNGNCNNSIDQDVDPYTIRTLNTISQISNCSNDDSTGRQSRLVGDGNSVNNIYKRPQITRSNNLNSSSPLAYARHQNQLTTTASPLMEPRRSATNVMLADNAKPVSEGPVYPFRSPLITANKSLATDVIKSNYSSPRMSAGPRLLQQKDTRQMNNTNDLSSPMLGSNRKQVVVNIAGAPGINLDPILAASLLEGTQIDAYQCLIESTSSSGYNQNDCFNNTINGTNKFLVSDRVSKSIANRKSLGNVELFSNNRSDRNAGNKLLSSDVDRISQNQEQSSWASSSTDEQSSATSSSSRTNRSISNNHMMESSSRQFRRKSSTTTTTSSGTTDRSQDESQSTNDEILNEERSEPLQVIKMM